MANCRLGHGCSDLRQPVCPANHGARADFLRGDDHLLQRLAELQLSLLPERIVPHQYPCTGGGVLLFVQPFIHGVQQFVDRFYPRTPGHAGCVGVYRQQHVDRDDYHQLVRATHAQPGAGEHRSLTATVGRTRRRLAAPTTPAPVNTGVRHPAQYLLQLSHRLFS